MIRMLRNTYYNGALYKSGEEYSIDEETESRWIRNKLAITVECDTSQDLFDTGNDDRQSLFDNEQPPEHPDFAEMTDEQLAEYAESIGVDISRVRSREAAIAKLEKAKQETELE